MTKRMVYVASTAVNPTHGTWHLLPVAGGFIGCVITANPVATRAELTALGAKVWPHLHDQTPLSTAWVTALNNHGVPVTATDTGFTALKKTFSTLKWGAIDPDLF